MVCGRGPDRVCCLVSSMPFHINFLEFMLKWQRFLSGLLCPLFVWDLVRRDWYYGHLHDDRVLMHTCLSIPTPPFVPPGLKCT